MEIYKKLLNVQAELKAPKNQYNSFGKYSYRSCEDILEAVKPILLKHKATIMISDDIVFIEGRHYVKVTVRFIDIETGDVIENTALARESADKKGQDESQITGSTSSYARKYALNGMFLIDDTKDADATNTNGKEVKGNNTPQTNKKLSEAQLKRLYAISSAAGYSPEKLAALIRAKYKCDTTEITKEQYDYICESLEKAKK